MTKNESIGKAEFIDWLNERIGPHEDDLFGVASTPHPTLHVLGLPRSGTTLATQLLARYTDVGYVSNLAAVFGSAPATGLALQKLLEGRASGDEMTSSYGKTHDIWEPHEFGYFWRALFDYPSSSEHKEPNAGHDNRINWRKVRKKLAVMTNAWGGPVMLKPLILCWHAARFAEEVPHSCFILIERDSIQNAISLYEARRKHSGIDTWFSLRPNAANEYQDASPEEQVAQQVRLLQESLNKQMAAVPSARVLKISYESICDDPKGFLHSTAEMLHNLGSDIEVNVPDKISGIRRSEYSLNKPNFQRIAKILGDDYS